MRQGWGTRVRATAGLIACVLAALLVPGAASAQSPAFTRVSASVPGGDAFAVIEGRPYVAYTARDGVHVASLSSTGDWKRVGAAVTSRGGRISNLSLAGGPDGAPWLVWREDSSSTTRLLAARFNGVAWQRVGGPLNRKSTGVPGSDRVIASDPELVFFGRRPYVAYLGDSIDVAPVTVRLGRRGRAWSDISPPLIARARDIQIASAGGRLFVAVQDGFVPSIQVHRLNSAGNGWESLPKPQSGDGVLADIANVDTRLEVLLADIAPADADASYSAPASLRVTRLGPEDAWHPVGAPVATGLKANEYGGQSLAAEGQVRYASWIPEAGADAGKLLTSRFVRGDWLGLPSSTTAGFTATSAVLRSGASGGIWRLSGETADGNSTAWRLDGASVSVPADPAPGACGTAVRGTGFADRLVGTRRADDIRGFGTGDRLFGRGGRDCLHGGGGGDRLFGGDAADFLEGRSGGDSIHGGPGADDLNGNAGGDRVFGGGGNDEVAAGKGNDRVYVAGGGSDLVDCGAGRDTVRISGGDLTRNCERVVELKR